MESNNKILLKPATTRVQKVLVMLFGTIFLNAIAWALMSKGSYPDLLIYVLFGLGFLLLTSLIHSLLGLINPKIKVFVNSSSVRLGETLDISWEAPYKIDRVKKLTLSLFLTESQSHGSGKNRRTKTKKLHDEVILETKGFNEMRSGSKSITIPEVFKASYSSDDYSLTWCLKINGEIPLFPDIDEDYKITVLPEDDVGIEGN